MSQLVALSPADAQTLSVPTVLTDPTAAVDRATRSTRAGVLRRTRERGLVSAEWAMAIIAAIAMVGVMVIVVRNGSVETALIDLFKSVFAGAAKLPR